MAPPAFSWEGTHTREILNQSRNGAGRKRRRWGGGTARRWAVRGGGAPFKGKANSHLFIRRFGSFTSSRPGRNPNQQVGYQPGLIPLFLLIFQEGRGVFKGRGPPALKSNEWPEGSKDKNNPVIPPTTAAFNAHVTTARSRRPTTREGQRCTSFICQLAD